MIKHLRLAKSPVFILFVFIFSSSAQTTDKISCLEKLKSGFAKREMTFKKDIFFAEKKSAESSEKKVFQEDANQTGEGYRLKRGEKELQFEFGVSPFNPSNFAGPKEFDVYGRDVYLANFRVGRVIGTKVPVTYQYLFGATPLAVFTKNEVTNPDYVSAAATPNIAPTKREITYGVAVQPVNFRFIFLPDRRYKPYAQFGAGILLTNKPVPVPQSRTLNFTGDFGGGLMYMISESRAVNFGYKYFHISNGNFGGKINNPGYNANVFSVSYSFFWK